MCALNLKPFLNCAALKWWCHWNCWFVFSVILTSTFFPLQTIDQTSQLFDQYVQLRTQQNFKFWIVSTIKLYYDCQYCSKSVSVAVNICKVKAAWLAAELDPLFQVSWLLQDYFFLAGLGPLFVGYQASGHKLQAPWVPSGNRLLTVTVLWTTENGKEQRIWSKLHDWLRYVDQVHSRVWTRRIV